MNRLVKVLFIIAVGLLLVKSSLSAAVFLWPKNVIDATGNDSANQLIKMTNNYRQSLGLNELAINPRLTQAAVNKAKDLLSKQYFSHTSPAGRKFSDWVKDVNYAYFYVGENLAMDFSTPQEIFDAWLKSPKHRENIVRPEFQEIGIADLRGKFDNRETDIVVQLFGSRVLGANELSDASISPNLINNYFGSVTNNPDYAQYFGLIDGYLNYLLFIAILLLVLIIAIRKIRKKKPASRSLSLKALAGGISPTLATVRRPIIRVSAKKQAPPLISLYTKRTLTRNENLNIAGKTLPPDSRKSTPKKSPKTTTKN